jgi:class 3 adenylate cyclase
MGALVSLVMSDIVESTRRWAADEAAMAADLELHDRVLRAALEGAGGTVCKHTGDGMLAMFDDPAAAVDAAAAIQRAVGASAWRHAEGLRVRVAVHAGLVHRRDSDLFGTAVNRVARLLGLCPPGAVLVSGVVAGMLAERALEALALRRVGAVTLTGFTTPEDVHALAGPGLTSVETVASSGGAARGGRLPAVDETLVGRDEELAAIWEALAQARLATLAGVGGMGKTRLALEIAAGAAESFADGAWWIDLTAATSEDAVLPVAMTAVEAREIPGRTKLQAFTDRFAEATGLVVFDNCEHVLPAARALGSVLNKI